MNRRNILKAFGAGIASLFTGIPAIEAKPVGPAWIIETNSYRHSRRPQYRFLRTVFSKITSNNAVTMSMQGSCDGVHFHDIENPQMRLRKLT